MNQKRLMIGNVVNSLRDLKRMKITELKENTASLVSLDGKETSEREYIKIEEIAITADNSDKIFKAMGFIDRKVAERHVVIVDKAIQLFSPDDNNVFYSIFVSPNENNPATWQVKIQDNNFSTVGYGIFSSVSGLQNIVKSCTDLDFTNINL